MKTKLQTQLATYAGVSVLCIVLYTILLGAFASSALASTSPDGRTLPDGAKWSFPTGYPYYGCELDPASGKIVNPFCLSYLSSTGPYNLVTGSRNASIFGSGDANGKRNFSFSGGIYYSKYINWSKSPKLVLRFTKSECIDGQAYLTTYRLKTYTNQKRDLENFIRVNFNFDKHKGVTRKTNRSCQIKVKGIVQSDKYIKYELKGQFSGAGIVSPLITGEGNHVAINGHASLFKREVFKKGNSNFDTTDYDNRNCVPVFRDGEAACKWIGAKTNSSPDNAPHWKVSRVAVAPGGTK